MLNKEETKWSTSLFLLQYRTDRGKTHWINVNESITLSSCASTESDCSPESLSKGECRRTGHEPALCLLHHASTQGRSLVLLFTTAVLLKNESTPTPLLCP